MFTALKNVYSEIPSWNLILRRKIYVQLAVYADEKKCNCRFERTEVENAEKNIDKDL